MKQEPITINEFPHNVMISKSEYDRLVRDSAWLACLDAAGVDNWQGIEFAAELWRHDPNNPDRGEQ